jgi:hypothetical protein
MSGVSIGWGVLGFTLGLALITGIIFGVAPAWQSSKTDLNETLKEGGRSTTDARNGRLRSAFVVAEVALAIVLLIGAGLLIEPALAVDSDPVLTPNVVTQLPAAGLRDHTATETIYSSTRTRRVEAACVLNDYLPDLEPVGKTTSIRGER